MKCWKNLFVCTAVFICLMLFAAPKANAATSGNYTYTAYEDYVQIDKCSTYASGLITIPSKLEGKPVTVIKSEAFYGCSKVTSVTIPSSVSSIGSKAFSRCDAMEVITFDGDFPSIYQDAFTEVYATAYYPASNPTWYPDQLTGFGGVLRWKPTGMSDDLIAFGETYWMKWSLDYNGHLEVVSNVDYLTTMPNQTVNNAPWYAYRRHIRSASVSGYETVGRYAFYGCDELLAAQISDDVKEIGEAAFSGCAALTSITLSDNLLAVGDHAFSGCSSLQSVFLPPDNNNQLTVGANAFAQCTALKEASLPAKIALGDYAFYNCTALRNIYINEFNYFDFDAKSTSFSGVTAEVNYPKKNSTYNMPSGNYGGALIWRESLIGTCGAGVYWSYDPATKELTLFGSGAVCGSYWSGNYLPWGGYLSEIQSVNILDGITHLPSYTFEYCTAAQRITLPGTLKTLWINAFNNCEALNNLLLPDSLEAIYRAGSATIPSFIRCYSLTDVYYFGTTEEWAALGTEIGNSYVDMKLHLLEEVSIPATCTQNGLSSHYRFDKTDVYDETYDENKDVITPQILPAQGHSFTVYKKDQNATCTDDGTCTAKCDRCEETDCVPDHNSKLGHSFTNYISDNNATCDTDGTKTAKCDRCEITDTLRDIGSGLPHSFTIYVGNDDNTCTQEGTATARCDRCDAKDTVTVPGSALGHLFIDYISDENGTCTKNGTMTAKCNRCNATDTQTEESSIRHAWDEGIYFPPTLKKEGYTTYTCTACGEMMIVVDVQGGEILAHPVPVIADSGDTVRFMVQTKGAVVSYQWQYRKIYKWFDTAMEGYNTDTLSVVTTGARNGYDYRCVITFADGTVLISDPAELMVKTYLTLTRQPNDQVVVLGHKGQFTAAAEGEGLKYQWQYQRPGSEIWIDTSMEGATKPTVMIETTTARDGYKYRCQITDVTGNEVFTEAATMTVLSFTSHPEEAFTRPDSTVLFTVTTSAADGFTYQWQYSKNGTTWSNTTMTGYDTAVLQVAATKARNGYQYRCILTGAKSSKIISKTATLHVGDPVEIEDQSVSCTVLAGKTVVFSVDATNVYTYRWQYQRPDGDRWIDTTMEGADTAMLKVQVTAARNGYRYRCVIRGLDGTETISETIVMTVK